MQEQQCIPVSSSKFGFICPKLLWMLLGKIEEFCHAQQLIQLKTDKTRGKEELWKFKYFTVQKYNLQKNPLIEETKILQDIIITL